jgi:hypothetical protein
MVQLVNASTTRSAVYVHLVSQFQFSEYLSKYSEKIHTRSDTTGAKTFSSGYFFDTLLEGKVDFYFCVRGKSVQVDGEEYLRKAYSDQMNQLISLIFEIKKNKNRIQKMLANVKRPHTEQKAHFGSTPSRKKSEFGADW